MAARPTRRQRALAALAAVVLALVALTGFGAGSALANNDSYCGHGTGHIAYHQWQTNRWRNIWASHQPPPGYGGHWNFYQKQYQPSYYPGTQWSWLWYDGGTLYKTGSGCV